MINISSNQGGGLLRSLSIQSRIVGALVMREILTRYGRHNIGFMWLFVEPMLFTLGIAALWTLTKATHGSSLPILPFAITGYSSVLLWRNGASRCANAIEPNKALLYHRNVRVIDFFLARLILEIGGATISFVVISCFFIGIGQMAVPADMFKLVIGWLMLAWFAVGLGLIVGAISAISEVIDRVWHTITYLIFPFSGALFMVDWLPKAAQEILLWIPMVHGTEMLREGYFGTAVHPHYSLAYLTIINLLLMLIGLTLLRDVARKVEGE